MKTNNNRFWLILLLFSIFPASSMGKASERFIEMYCDRVVIYPQRMTLTGAETLLDILMAYPDLIQGGFKEIATSYNVRIDNSTVNLDMRLFMYQLKAKEIERIQICDNTGVAKGTLGLGRVIDINLVRKKDGLNALYGMQFGSDNLYAHSVQGIYGSEKTKLYASGSFDYKDKSNEISQAHHLGAHMTNWLSPHSRLQTYFTQQYSDYKFYNPDSHTKIGSHEYTTKTRFFFDLDRDIGNWLIGGGYQYSNAPQFKMIDEQHKAVSTAYNVMFGVVELNTSLSENVQMMLGWECDKEWNSVRLENDESQKFGQMNNDIYIRFDCTFGDVHLSVGDRMMYFNYSISGNNHNEVRHNFQSSLIATLSETTQLQAAYHRKFSNPSFIVDDKVTEDEWLLRKENLKASYIDEIKIGYTHSRKDFSFSLNSYLLDMDFAEKTWKVQAATYGRVGWFVISAGVNFFNPKGYNNDYTTFIVNPRLLLPCQLQIGGKAIVASKHDILPSGEKNYLAFHVEKQIGKHLSIGVDWHDVLSKTYAACLGKIEYRF